MTETDHRVLDHRVLDNRVLDNRVLDNRDLDNRDPAQERRTAVRPLVTNTIKGLVIDLLDEPTELAKALLELLQAIG